MKLWATAGVAAILVSAASAQNYNAFKAVDGFHDVSITQAGNSFTLSLGANPTVTRTLGGGKTRTSDIKDVTGFWLLGSMGDLGVTQSAQNNFHLQSNTGGGTSAYGWHTQNKNGITANQSVTFSITGGDLSKLTEFGLSLHAKGIEDHVKLPCNKQPVPEPASIIALASGGLVLLRRRKK